VVCRSTFIRMGNLPGYREWLCPYLLERQGDPSGGESGRRHRAAWSSAPAAWSRILGRRRVIGDFAGSAPRTPHLTCTGHRRASAVARTPPACPSCHIRPWNACARRSRAADGRHPARSGTAPARQL